MWVILVLLLIAGDKVYVASNDHWTTKAECEEIMAKVVPDLIASLHEADPNIKLIEAKCTAPGARDASWVR